MMALIWHTLRRMKWHIIGWSLGMAYMGSVVVLFADNLTEQAALMQQFIDALPQGVMDFLGGMDAFITPAGFIDGKLFSQLPLMMGIFAIIVGSGLVVADEENGMMDVLLGQPVSRTKLFFSRVLGVAVGATIIFAVAAVATILPLGTVDLDISPGRMALAFLPAWAQIIFFITFTLLLSMVLPSQKIAASVSGAYLIFGYILTGMANINADWVTAARFSPLYYYQGGAVLYEAMAWSRVLAVLALAILCAVAAWRRFLARDLRVRGEGSWRVTTEQKNIGAG